MRALASILFGIWLSKGRVPCKIGLHKWTTWLNHGMLVFRYCPKCGELERHDLAKLPKLRDKRS